MQDRTQVRQAPQPIAHLMSRPGEPHEEGPIRFRVQTDRRQAEALANGVADRRSKRSASVSVDAGANTLDATATSAAADVARKQ